MLAIGPSTAHWSRDNSPGLFTTVDVADNTFLCIKKGTLLNGDFWSRSDYKTSHIRMITMTIIDATTNQQAKSIMDKDRSVSYSDFVKDSLDPNLVNAEFIEVEDDGIIVLKCTKPLKAYSELFISFGKKSWIAEFRTYEWSLANKYNTMVKKAMSVYNITKDEIINAVIGFKTSVIIQNYISSHMAWENPENHSYVNVLVWKKNSCYINVVLQCLARIPALTQLLLDTNLFHNMDENTFLYNYITLLKLMTEKKEKESTMKKYGELILDRRRELSSVLSSGGQEDSMELFLYLLDKFCEENSIFEYIRYHLFAFYIEGKKFCSNGHDQLSLDIQYVLTLLIGDCKESKDKASLYSGIIQSMKIKEIEKGRKCPHCVFEKKEYKTFENCRYLHLPNIFVIRIQRTNNDRTPIDYDKYMTLPEGDLEVHYELIGLITHDGVNHYVAYVLNPCNEWWLLDDMIRADREPTKDPIQVPASEVYSQNKFAYSFFYRKINDRLMNSKTIDMVIDCYGENPDDKSNTPNSVFNKVAVALSLPIDKNNPGVVSEECIEIVRQFKFCKIKHLNEFQSFLKAHNLNLHFWRQVTTETKKKKGQKVEDNSHSGFLVNFLLHKGVRTIRPHYWLNDNCFDKNYKINENEFTQYYDELVNRSDYFDDIKPSIGRLVRYGDDEVFENCDQWIYNRITKFKNKEITSINKETCYHIMHAYLEWIRTNKLAMFSTPYPGYKLINEISVDCRFKPSIFRYIKGSCNFSVFMSTDNLNFPHIPNYYILCYSTNYDDIKMDYTFNDLEITAGNLNHISCNNNLRFCLLPTFPFLSSYHQAVQKLIDHMNYILDYEEWPVNFPEEPLQRWGEAPIARAYHETEVETKINNNKLVLF